LTKVMSRHRICLGDLYAFLRQKNILDLSEIECVFIDANGSFTIYTREQVGARKKVDVLLQVPSYKALCDDADERIVEETEGKVGLKDCDDHQNKLAGDAC